MRREYDGPRGPFRESSRRHSEYAPPFRKGRRDTRIIWLSDVYLVGWVDMAREALRDAGVPFSREAAVADLVLTMVETCGKLPSRQACSERWGWSYHRTRREMPTLEREAWNWYGGRERSDS